MCLYCVLGLHRPHQWDNKQAGQCDGGSHSSTAVQGL